MDMKKMSNYHPEIIAFLCQWCAYAAADNAGRARLEFPSNLKAIRIMCSGRVAPEFILEAFKKGADGVLIAGCIDGSCHYKKGNQETVKRVMLLQNLLKGFNIETDRILFEGVKADDPQGLSVIINRFIKNVASLGPLENHS
jgi:F420-non-reducing hydrogenase iron-sulfur subunit